MATTSFANTDEDGNFHPRVMQRLTEHLNATTGTAAISRSQALAPWCAALANRDNAPARWYALGDSITEGWDATSPTKRWVQRSLNLLRHRYPTAGLEGGGIGVLPPYYEGTTLGNPYTSSGLAGATGLSKDASFGYGRRSIALKTSQFLEYTVTATSLNVNYVQGGGGEFNISVDGGTPVLVQTGGALQDGKIWNSGALTPGQHTVRVTGVSGNSFFNGITVFNGDENKGIQLYEAGHPGFTTGHWVNGYRWEETITATQPHLVTIALLANDYSANIDPAVSAANLVDLIGRFRNKTTTDPGFALVLYPSRADQDIWAHTPSHTWTDYVAASHEVAADDPGVTVIDLSQRIQGPATNTLGMWDPADLVHPTDKGHAVIADQFVGLISPA